MLWVMDIFDFELRWKYLNEKKKTENMNNKENKQQIIEKLQAENQSLEQKLQNYPDTSADARKLELINALHKYNEVKDSAQIIIGALANVDGLTIKRVHEKLQLPLEWYQIAVMCAE